MACTARRGLNDWLNYTSLLMREQVQYKGRRQMTSKKIPTADVPDERREQKVERREVGDDRRDAGRVDVESSPRRQQPERRGPKSAL